MYRAFLPICTRRIHWPLSDPAKATGTEGEIMARFRETRGDVESRVRTLLEELAKGN
jgi:arsenate reductase